MEKRKILVYPNAFGSINVYTNLVSALFDHEPFHIKQWNQHSLELTLRASKAKSREEKFRFTSVSKPAYENQLKNADFRGFSSKISAESFRLDNLPSRHLAYKPKNEFILPIILFQYLKEIPLIQS